MGVGGARRRARGRTDLQQFGDLHGLKRGNSTQLLRLFRER